MSRNKITFTTAVVSGALLLGGLTACNRDQSTASLLAEAKQYQQKGDEKAALIQLKNAVAKSPEDAEARLQLGMLYLDSGDAVSASKELRKAASLGMTPARTLPLLAKSMQAQGQFKEMLAELKPELTAKSAPLTALRCSPPATRTAPRPPSTRRWRSTRPAAQPWLACRAMPCSVTTWRRRSATWPTRLPRMARIRKSGCTRAACCAA